MTCAGLLAMAIGYGLDLPNPAKSPMQDPNIQKGLKYVAKTIPQLDPKVVPPRPPIYALWSIERVCVLFDLKKIEDKDWYRWGVRILQNHQRPTAVGSSRPPPMTAFRAVRTRASRRSFLHRANLVQDLTDKFNEMIGPGPSQPPAIPKQ